MAPAIRKANAYLDKLATARAHTSDPAAQKKLDSQIAAWSRRITDYRTR